jgi:hypothetical protein
VFEVSGTAAGAYADGCGEDVVAQVRELVVADGEIILDEIARERALLDRLEREAAEARARLNALEASVSPRAGSSVTIAAPTTPAAKVALFRRLFRGRDDVYPRYWENLRNGRRGYLITETMTRRHELSLESYDRLFPNQDTLPRGGFGNLIALPLQRAARQRGNTVFIDDALVPFHDQWAFLAGVRQIDPGAVEAIADEGTRRGEIIGLQISQTEDVNEEKPWARGALRSS